MRLVQRDTHRNQALRAWPKLAASAPLCHAFEHGARQELSRGVLVRERRVVVQVAEVEPFQDRRQRLRGATDVDHHALSAQLWRAKLGVHDVSCAVQALCGTKQLTAEA